MKKILFGWCVDENGNEVPDEREQNIIFIVRGYRLNGLSFKEIAEKFTSAKFLTHTGYAVFNEEMIKRINDSELVVYN